MLLTPKLLPPFSQLLYRIRSVISKCLFDSLAYHSVLKNNLDLWVLKVSDTKASIVLIGRGFTPLLLSSRLVGNPHWTIWGLVSITIVLRSLWSSLKSPTALRSHTAAHLC